MSIAEDKTCSTIVTRERYSFCFSLYFNGQRNNTNIFFKQCFDCFLTSVHKIIQIYFRRECHGSSFCVALLKQCVSSFSVVSRRRPIRTSSEIESMFLKPRNMHFRESVIGIASK